MGRIFFEASDIVYYVQSNRFVTGIQRVVLSLLKELSERADAERYFIAYRAPSSKDHHAFPLTDLKDIDFFDADILRQIFRLPALYDALLPRSLWKYAGRPDKLKYHSRIRQMNAILGNKRHFRKRNDSIENWREYKKKTSNNKVLSSFQPPSLSPFETTITQGDQYVILGAFWDLTDMLDSVTDISERGIKVTLLIHDLIPIKTPAYVVSSFMLNYLNDFEDLVKVCTSYLTVSQKTKEDLETVLAEYGVSAEIQVMPLVQQFLRQEIEPHGTTGDYIRKVADFRKDVLAVADRPYVLCVGSMDGRKNNLGLAQAWQRLLADHSLEVPRLIFAGGKGALNEAFTSWMEASGHLGGWVQIIEKPSDAELGYLYQHCIFTAFPSFYEGWGLPVGESLSYGKTAVVANGSSLPEVGQDMVQYCDPYSVNDIARACRELLTNDALRAELEGRIAARKLRNWADVSGDMLDALDPIEP